MKYFVDIDGTRVEVELDGETARVDGGAPRHAHLVDVAGTPVRLVTIDGAMHRLTARRDGARGRYVVRIDGRRHLVEALDARTRAIRDLSAAAAGPLGPQPLRAPMPGLIVRVSVAPGDDVEAGQGIVAMEAMKMENELRSPAAGIVKAVHARVGTAVEKGALLVEFE
ncbi:MAG: biotin/lipoyl-binding protein [Gemmatimonadetes bacterium]|nr:biotin/lipoyl-binding protein [Gemmatimonadota bacterium]MBI3567153.1 biotin/lipoyl-binding protein [Gemmatimonadota bacterium]